MRFISILTIFMSLGVGGYWAWNNVPELRVSFTDALSLGNFQTLEVRHTAESIMETHRRELLADSEHSFLSPSLKFYPYLLMEVKYTNRHSNKTEEGIILWSLVDGEMVINTASWEKTHGFNDCILSGAGDEEFRIINTLASHQNHLDREGLLRALNVEDEKLTKWLNTCRKKNLIVQNGNYFRLHFQNPRLKVSPSTKLDQWLVTKPNRNANRASKRFRPSQIEQIARSAFGKDFAVRKKTEIFLPVYSIIVQNPDGSQMTTYWNALNGKRINKHYHFE